MGRTARRSYDLSQVEIVPSRRTRSSKEVSTTWQLDAYRFEIPLVTHPTDAVVSPANAVRIGKLGGLGVLNAEGLWARHADAEGALARVVEAAASDDPDAAVRILQELHAAPIRDGPAHRGAADRARGRRDRRGAGEPAARPRARRPLLLAAGVEVLVVQGTIISAEHVSTRRAAQPQGLHRLPGDPGGRGRGRRLPHRDAPHAHRRGGRDRRVRASRRRPRRTRCSASGSRWPPRSSTPPPRGATTSTRPAAATSTSSRTAGWTTPATWPRRSPAARTR